MPTISVWYACSAPLLSTGRFLGALLEIVSKWHTSASVYTQVGHCHQQWTELAPWQLVFLFSVVFGELTMALDNLWDVQWNVTSAIRTHWSSKHIGQPNDLPIYCFLINAHILWRTSVAWEDGSTRVYFAVLNRSLLFCRHLFFICDPACTVVLRMSSVTPQKWKCCVLSIQQKFEICDRLRNGWRLLVDLSRVWDWKVNCVRHQYEYDEHVPCQASGLQNIQSYRQGSVPTCSDDWHSTVFLIHILFRVDNFYKIANVLMYFVYTWICSAIWLALPDLTTRSQVQFFWRVLPCSPIPPQGEPLEWSHT